jgi:L-lactate dehydrogenase complex protein LldG
MNKEQALLERIAQRLGRLQPLREKPKRDVMGPPDFWREFLLSETEKIERFCESWRALTGVVEVVETDEQARSVLTRWIQEEKVRCLIRWDHPELERLEIDQSLVEAGVQINVWGRQAAASSLAGAEQADAPERLMIELANRAEAGITWVDYAVADTGTLCLFTSPGKGRSVSLLPPIHISIFRSEQLVTRIGEVMVKIDEMTRSNQLPAAINFITGPSRSSDIENDMTIGVHGPKKVYALILR